MNIDFTKLTPKQLAVFEQVATGHSYGHPQRVIRSLERKGFLSAYGYPIEAVSVPIPVHIAWCQWCAKRVEDNSQ